ncbi:hypothetical protein AKJ16_DCAP27214 [Drosera capensis]
MRSQIKPALANCLDLLVTMSYPLNALDGAQRFLKPDGISIPSSYL